MSYLYGQPNPGFGLVSAGVWISSPRQAMLMERVLSAAMADYAGKPEETILAKWHREIVRTRENAKRQSWPGWEDEYPVEHPPASKD